MKYLYLALCVIGTAMPLSQFIPWLRDFGFDFPLFLTELLGSHVSAFFAWDVFVSAIVVGVFAFAEGKRLGSQAIRWLPIAATCLVGVSLGLPLLLYLREVRKGATA